MENLIELCHRHNYSNGWYHLRNDKCFCNNADEKIAAFSLYRQDGSLVADNLEKCDVYPNGWYSLQKKDIVVLYRHDEQPEYVGVTSFMFSPSGKFVVSQGKDKIVLHDYDGHVIADSLKDVHVFEDGSYVYQKKGENKCQFFSSDDELLAERHSLYFLIEDSDEVSLYQGWDDDPCNGVTYEWDIYRKNGTYLRNKVSQL